MHRTYAPPSRAFPLLLALCCLLPLLGLAGGTAHAATSAPAAPGERQLLIGQSSKAAWDDWTSFGQDPAGGSVYYEVA
ncbi:hypothetical protein G3I76_70250, partial [Streptomyces sp. SID11233]|nr:hypothetical protein [Streptomyces sp. SID11233]